MNRHAKKITAIFGAAAFGLALGACAPNAAQDEAAELALLNELNEQTTDASTDAENFAASAAINVGGYSVKMERVRYCQNWLCTRAETASNFKEWEWENVDGGKQRETYLAVVSQPARGNVENIVFMSAGQQTTLDGNGYNNMVTGQPKDYKKNCKGKTKYCYRTLDGRSLARRVMTSGKFPLNKTLFILAFDARFDYTTGTSEKQKIENAYYRWLTNRSYSWKLKNIYMAGQSRGGCLAFRLAKRFRDNSSYRNIPMILQGLDAVCNKQQGEFNTTGTKYYNPLNSSYYSWKIDMNARFPYKNKLAIQQIHGGQQVVWIAPFGVRAFTYKSYNTDLGWWKQTWVNRKHSDMGRDYANAHLTVDPSYAHMLSKWNEFN